MTMIRVGQGYDIHAFETGRPLIIGGEAIQYSRGLQGHSDADVLLHALSDALLGALALGDIGMHFPATTDWKDTNSRIILQSVYTMLSELNWKLINADSTIIAQAPILSPYISAMRDNIAQILHCHKDQISIKATTTDKLGCIGAGEGIACYSTVLIEKSD